MLKRWVRIDPVRVRSELVCPRCGYSLRGVHGDIGTCPECGLVCDLAAMMVRQWSGPWHKVPGFRTLILPIVWPGVGGWFVLLAFAWESSSNRLPVAPIIISALLLAGWLWSMGRVRRVMPWRRGLALAALAHVAAFSMLVGVIGVGFLIADAVVRGRFGVGSAFFVWIVPSIGVIVLSRVAERYIAACCLRQYLVGAATADGSQLSADS